MVIQEAGSHKTLERERERGGEEDEKNVSEGSNQNMGNDWVREIGVLGE